MTNPPRTIRRDTRVFISAVTRELGTVRRLVKKGLEDNDYHTVEQDNFPPDYRDLVDKLRFGFVGMNEEGFSRQSLAPVPSEDGVAFEKSEATRRLAP